MDQLTPVLSASDDSAIDRMVAIGGVLEANGLPPTSVLLLNLSGRGSKGTAVQVARDLARARFEKARTPAVPARPVDVGAAPAGLRQEDLQIMAEEVAHLIAVRLAAEQPTGAVEQRETRVEQMLDQVIEATGGIRGELVWLKSTIDTERELRRQLQDRFAAAPQQATPAPAAPVPRQRQVISNLTSSLERDRFKGDGPAASLDPADGYDE